MLKKLASHSLIYGLGPFVPKILGLLMLPVFTAVLTPEDYGVQGVLNSTMGLIGVLAMLGLNLPLTNAFYHHSAHYKKRWGQFYGFLNIWMLFYAIMLSCLIYFIVPDEARPNVLWIILLNVAPMVLFGPTATMGQLYYQLNQKPLPIVVRTIAISFITVALNYYTIVVLDLHYMGWFISSCAATLLLNGSYWYALHYRYGVKPIYRFKADVIKRGLSVSLPMIPHYYGAFLLASADVLILKLYNVDTAQIGFYAFAASFGGIMALAVGALNTSAGPIMMELIKEKKYTSLASLTWTIQSMLLAVSSLGCIWLKEVFPFFVKNENLVLSYSLAVVFIMAHNYRPMYFGASSILFYRERTRNLWKVTFGAGVFCVLANIALVPVWGFKVPAYVLFFSYLIMGYGAFLLRDYKEVEVVDFKPARWFAVTVTAFMVVLAAMDFPTPFKIIALGGLLCAMIVFLHRRSGLLKHLGF